MSAMAKYIVTAYPQANQLGVYEGVLYIRVPVAIQHCTSTAEVHQACSRFSDNVVAVWDVNGQYGAFHVQFGVTSQFGPTPMAAAQLAAQRLNGAVDLTGQQPVHDNMPIHERVAGAVIGHGGENLRRIKQQSGAYVEVTPYDGCNATRNVKMIGTPQAVEAARQLVNQTTQQALRDRQSQCPAAYLQPPPIHWPGISQQQQQQAPPETNPQVAAGEQAAAPSPPAFAPYAFNVTTPWSAYNVQQPQMPQVSAAPPSQPYANSIAAVAAPPPPPFAAPTPPVAAAPLSPTIVGNNPRAAQRSAISLQRNLSENTLAQIPRAGWCLLKDRISLMSDIRDAAAQFKNAQQTQKVQQQLERVKMTKSKSCMQFMKQENATVTAAVEPRPTWANVTAIGRTASHDDLKGLNVVTNTIHQRPAKGCIQGSSHVQFGSLPAAAICEPTGRDSPMEEVV